MNQEIEYVIDYTLLLFLFPALLEYRDLDDTLEKKQKLKR